MSPPFVLETFSILFGALLTGILVYQYAARNTTRSRIALASMTALFLGLFSGVALLYFAGPVNMFIRHHYPAFNAASVRLAFDSSQLGYGEPAHRRVMPGAVLIYLNLPVQIEGLSPSVRLHDANVSFTLTAPGYHYASTWRPVVVTGSNLLLLIPKSVFNRVHAQSVRIHLTLVAQRLLPGAPQVVTVANSFAVPDEGRCTLVAGFPANNLICRYAFQSPPATVVRGSVATQSCAHPGPTHVTMAPIRSTSPGTRPDPVIQDQLMLGGVACPGTKLTFVAYKPAGNFRLELDIPAITLDHYTSH